MGIIWTFYFGKAFLFAHPELENVGKMFSTPGSNVVIHRSTSWAGTCLTSLS